MTAPKPSTVPELHIALDMARRSISELMRHSCIADSAPEDKDGDDHEAESRALRTIRVLDEVIDPAHLQPLT